MNNPNENANVLNFSLIKSLQIKNNPLRFINTKKCKVIEFTPIGAPSENYLKWARSLSSTGTPFHDLNMRAVEQLMMARGCTDYIERYVPEDRKDFSKKIRESILRVIEGEYTTALKNHII